MSDESFLIIDKTVKPLQSKFVDVYDDYILWFATPKKAKQAMKVESNTDFAEYYGITGRTLLNWRDRPDFEVRVRALRKKWAFEKTGDVLDGIYKSASNGNDKSQKLWMQLFEGFTETTETIETKKVELSINDLRFMIEGFPEESRAKYYGYITEIVDYAVMLRASGRLENRTQPSQNIEAKVLDETHIDAQDVRSGERTDEVATGDKERILGHLDTNPNGTAPTSENNNQSS